MLVMCGWENKDEIFQVTVIESASVATLAQDFRKRMQDECAKHDSYKGPCWTRPTDAKLKWYKPQNGLEQY